jgi:hypothetical protein
MHEDRVQCQGYCKEDLPRESFYKNRSKKNGLSIFCKECTKIAVSNYQQRKKRELYSPQVVVPCKDGCGNQQTHNAQDGRCADCRYKLKMRLKYRENSEYYKKKNTALRLRRASISAEVEREEMENISRRVKLKKGDMLLLNQFTDTTWRNRREVDPLNIFSDDLERIMELGFLKSKEEDDEVKFALTEKGLKFLGLSNDLLEEKS